MSELKLLNCPFCGCSNIQFWETDNDTHRFQIVCMQCFNGTDECISEEVAIEKWNRRTPMANIVEKLEYEKERHEKDRAYWSDKPWKDSCVYNEYDMADRKIDCYDDAINIVKQEINNGLE